MVMEYEPPKPIDTTHDYIGGPVTGIILTVPEGKELEATFVCLRGQEQVERVLTCGPGQHVVQLADLFPDEVQRREGKVRWSHRLRSTLP